MINSNRGKGRRFKKGQKKPHSGMTHQSSLRGHLQGKGRQRGEEEDRRYCFIGGSS